MKLELYERMHKSKVAESRKVAMIPTVPTPGRLITLPDIWCYNCGDQGHQSLECPDVGKEPEFFAC